MTALPVYNEGIPFEVSCPDTLNLVKVAALALNRARHGDSVAINQGGAQRRARLIAENLQEHLGTRVSLSACLALAAYLIESKACELDPQGAVS